MSQPSPLAMAQHRAHALRAADDLSGARRLLEDVLKTARPAYGEDHPEVLATAHLLAQLHRQADDAPAARRVLETALEAALRRGNDPDALTLAISADLGAVAEELGNRHEARRNYRRVATAGPAVLGEDHPAVREAQAYLGDAVSAQPPPPEQATAQPPASEQATTPQPTPEQAAAQPPAPQPPVAAPLAPEPATTGEPTTQPPTPSAPPVSAPPRSAPPFAAPYVPSPPYGRTSPAPAASRRGATVAAVLAAVLAVAAAVAAVFVVLHVSGGGPRPGVGAANADPDGPGAPPTEVRLRDAGGDVTITWQGPSGGKAPVIVKGGRAGQPQLAMATLPAGTASYTAHGLGPDADYCFTVLAVYADDAYAASDEVCTDRRASSAPR